MIIGLEAELEVCGLCLVFGTSSVQLLGSLKAANSAFKAEKSTFKVDKAIFAA